MKKRWMDLLLYTVFTLIVLISIGGPIYLVYSISTSPVTREVVKIGEVMEVEYLQGNFTESTKTIVHFMDGTKVVFRGTHSVLSKKIAVINDSRYSGYQFEEVEE